MILVRAMELFSRYPFANTLILDRISCGCIIIGECAVLNALSEAIDKESKSHCPTYLHSQIQKRFCSRKSTKSALILQLWGVPRINWAALELDLQFSWTNHSE